MTRTELIAKVYELRQEGLTYKQIDQELAADAGLLDGCSYRDFSYRVSKTTEYQQLLKNDR